MRTFKIMVDGPGGCGKTIFTNSLTKDFSGVYVRTLGCEIEPVRFGGVCFNMWDMAGHEQFRGLGDAYFAQAQGIFICFDLSQQQSLIQALNRVNDLGQEVPIVILGLKKDICDPRVKALADDFFANYTYLEVSCKTRENVERAFGLMKNLVNL